MAVMVLWNMCPIEGLNEMVNVNTGAVTSLDTVLKFNVQIVHCLRLYFAIVAVLCL